MPPKFGRVFSPSSVVSARSKHSDTGERGGFRMGGKRGILLLSAVVFIAVVIAVVCAAVTGTTKDKIMEFKPLSPMDPNSFSRPDLARVINAHFELEVSFKKETMEGFIILTIEREKDNVGEVILDVDDLNIKSVTGVKTGKELQYEITSPVPDRSSKMVIHLPPGPAKTNIEVNIEYSTPPGSKALMWLKPSNTYAKTHPYLASHSNSRAMFPIQDNAAVKFPWTASITAPNEMTVLLSGLPKGDPEVIDGGKKTISKFEQPVPMSAYLIAIAVGKMESRQIGPISKVWTEVGLGDKAAYDFSDTADMMEKYTKLCGDYVWGQYDLVVLPPAYFMGGMENPGINFLTPTLLAGDKSLDGVVSHEMAHSWTGNLVTTKNFEHFWINEGFTTFLQRKMAGIRFGEPMRHFQMIGGWKNMEYTISVRGEDDPSTALVLDLSKVGKPSEAFSNIPYEKGSLFLWFLEDLVGGSDEFDPFLRQYFEDYKYDSLDSFEFKKYFLDYFERKGVSGLDKIDWDDWFFSTGTPKYKPDYDYSLAKICQDLRDRWLVWDAENEPSPFSSTDLDNFHPLQKVEFLALLLKEDPLSHQKLAEMRDLYGLNEVENAEIKFRWIRLGLLAKWEDSVPRALQMVSDVGRLKFVRPIYRDLYAWEEMRPKALETFEKNKVKMLESAINNVKKDLHLNEE